MEKKRREFKRSAKSDDDSSSDRVREFKRSDFKRSGSRGSRGSNGRSGRREKTEMFSVICDECGKNCEVPFKPTSSKPIYCDECFRKKDGRGSNKHSYNNRENDSSNEFKKINEKLDKIISYLELK
jgi:CxxC-x17-CxxC domain-containing protein